MARYRAEGEAAFEPRSRRPNSSPSATPPEVVDLVLRLRNDLEATGVDAGAHTICWHLHQQHGVAVSVATVWRICTRAGLVVPEPKKRPKSSYLRFQAELPNQMWQSDFTHWKLTCRGGQHVEVEVLNILDDHSRYLIAAVATTRVTGPLVAATFQHAFDQHGVPASVLTDDGMVFTTRFAGGRRGRHSRNGLETLFAAAYSGRCMLASAVVMPGLDVVRTALDHLVALGHRDIAHLDGGSIHGATDRRRSYRTLMRRSGLAQYIRTYSGGNTEADGMRPAELVAAEAHPPTAVIAFNDRSAVGLIFGLRRAGLSVPEDVSVIGYDDIPMAMLPFVDLTTVGQDAIATAQHAFKDVSGRLEANAPSGGQGLVPPYLAVRSTTAVPVSASVLSRSSARKRNHVGTSAGPPPRRG